MRLSNSDDLPANQVQQCRDNAENDGVLRVEGVVKGKEMQLLVDSGASRNFMSAELAAALGVNQQRYGSNRPQIKLGDGDVVPVVVKTDVPVWIEGTKSGI